MNGENIIWVVISIVLVSIFGFILIFAIIKSSDKEGKVCTLDKEYLKLVMERSVIHRKFCIDKGLEPIYPEIKVGECKTICYESVLGICTVNMDKEIRCKDKNQELKIFMIG